MHRGHDHHDHGGASAGLRHPGPGHNGATARPPAQWQTPHRHDGEGLSREPDHEPDLDLVETAFVDGFSAAADPTSFLRLAQVPFAMAAADGAKLTLLRVEIDAVTDVGSLMPHLGGASFRYDPLPAAMVTRRRHLRFVYFDGEKLRPLSLQELRAT
jgi:hypothetical protein